MGHTLDVIDRNVARAEEAAYRMRALGMSCIKALWAAGFCLYGFGAAWYWFGGHALTHESISCIGPLGVECPQPVYGPSVTTLIIAFLVALVALAALSAAVWFFFLVLSQVAYDRALNRPAPMAF